MIIRDMTLADRKEYIEMAIDFYGGHATLFPVDETNLDATLAEAAKPQALTRLLVLEDEGSIIGYGNLSFTFSTEAGGKVVWLEELYLKESRRSKGYGQQYFDWVFRNYPDAARFRL